MGSTYYNNVLVSPMNHTLFKQIQTSKPIPTMMFSSLTNEPGYGRKSVHRPIRCTATTTPETLSSPTMVENHQGRANYKPSVWNLEFIESLKRDQIVMQDKYAKIDKESIIHKAKNKLSDENLEPLMAFELIDGIQRSGLGKKFSDDIQKTLRKLACNFDDLHLNLHATALGFRLLRQNRIMISQDVFRRFMDESGNFKPSLYEDIKGIISLYEASYLAYEGEHLLDEAKAFTYKRLTKYSSNEDELIANQVNRALDLPIRHQMQKLEERYYLETFCTKADTNKDFNLLDLAKLDFNMTQLVYQEELQESARWWKDLNLSKVLSFARDRLMECAFWGVGTAPKSEHSYCRTSLTKVYKMTTVLDDIYDIYGQMHELELFTNVVERWDINAIEDLPDYMKLTFLALYNIVNEIAYEILKEKGHNCIPFLKKGWEDLLKAFLLEAKWYYHKQTPTFEEYMNNGWVSASGANALTHAYFFVSQDITPEALECLKNYHDVLRLSSMIFRLTNDLVTFEAEIERGETANSITLYARETGLSIKDAHEHISNLIEESWKRLNEIQVVNETPFSDDFIEIALNLARTATCIYHKGDGHGTPELIKQKILSILVHPLE